MRERKLLVVMLCLMLASVNAGMAAENLPPAADPSAPGIVVSTAEALASGSETAKTPEDLLKAIFAPTEPSERASCPYGPCPWGTGCCWDPFTECCYGRTALCSIC